MTATAADIVKKTAEQDYESAQVLATSVATAARKVSAYVVVRAAFPYTER